ncbi:MAG: hypothetical protein K0Q55_2679 [Verrucomicrobia bacterium]|jgi:hypothetical protein|nr:hypothetical protein [Verrucomicrobiota bacterium]
MNDGYLGIIVLVIFFAIFIGVLIYGWNYDPFDKLQEVMSHPVFGTVERYSQSWEAMLTEPEWGEVPVCGEDCKDGFPNAIQVKTYQQIKVGFEGLLIESAIQINVAYERKGAPNGSETLSPNDLKLECINLYGTEEGKFSLHFTLLKKDHYFAHGVDVEFEKYKPSEVVG